MLNLAQYICMCVYPASWVCILQSFNIWINSMMCTQFTSFSKPDRYELSTPRELRCYAQEFYSYSTILHPQFKRTLDTIDSHSAFPRILQFFDKNNSVPRNNQNQKQLYIPPDIMVNVGNADGYQFLDNSTNKILHPLSYSKYIHLLSIE